MVSKLSLGIVDYVIIVISILISTAIGIYLRIRGGEQRTTREYLMAGKNMPMIPVILSIIATMTSGNVLLATPVEIYKYGVQILIGNLTVPLGIVLAAYIFIPVYFNCGVSTVNEFLEMRFGKWTRTTISILLSLQMLVYMSVVLYGSVLALTAVTDISMNMSIISLGAVCALYCFLGGLKAVLWTDVYQSGLIFICIIAMFVAGVQDGGGVQQIYHKLDEGKRINFFDFQLNFIKRYTFWSCFSRGLLFGIACYGTNQLEVQRVLSMKDANKARSTLLRGAVPVSFTFGICTFFGVVLYAVYYNCDPILNQEYTGLDKYDQMVPYYIITRFSSIPGMTGLCIAGIFSASLSSISSALNSLSTVTVVDFIKPLMRRFGQISDVRTVCLAKGLTILYGGICIGLSFFYLGLSSLMQLANSVINSTEGPMLAVFLIGVLTRKVSDKIATFSFLASFGVVTWIAIGSLYSDYQDPYLPVSTSMCTNIMNRTDLFCDSSENCSSSSLSPTYAPTEEPFILYKTSFMWHSFFGFALTLILAALLVLVTGWRKNVIPADSKCLSPVTNLWMKRSEPDNQGSEVNVEIVKCNITETQM